MWSAYLQKFHLNICHKKGSTNMISDCLSRPLITRISMVLESCGHQIENWAHLYAYDNEFSDVYIQLVEGKHANYYYLQDGMLSHFGQICVHEEEHKKLIWEARYSKVAGHFGIGKTTTTIQIYFY